VFGGLISENRAEAPKELTKEERDQLKSRALKLQQQAFRFYQQGKFVEATKTQKQVLDIQHRLYSKDEFPRGHPSVAAGLDNVGFLLEAQGEYGQALDYYRKALKIFERLYPKSEYPKGHPDVAHSLNNVGNLLRLQGEYDRAWDYLEGALAIRE